MNLKIRTDNKMHLNCVIASIFSKPWEQVLVLHLSQASLVFIIVHWIMRHHLDKPRTLMLADYLDTYSYLHTTLYVVTFV